jgi:hypothetical protein
MRSIVQWLVEGPQRVASHLAWLAPLFARITVGWVFLWSGWGKLNSLPQVTENFVGWGIPNAHVLAPFVSGVEFFGGLLLLVGLLSRISAGAQSGLTSIPSKHCWGSTSLNTWRSSCGSQSQVRVSCRSITFCSEFSDAPIRGTLHGRSAFGGLAFFDCRGTWLSLTQRAESILYHWLPTPGVHTLSSQRVPLKR